MPITTIPYSRLETDLEKMLNECAESGETVVIEMPDQRLLAIHSLEPHEDDSLIDELLASNPKFQALVAKSKASTRQPFATRDRLEARAERSEAPALTPPGLQRPSPGHPGAAGHEASFGKKGQGMTPRVGTPRPGTTEVPLADLNPLHPVPRPNKPPNHIPNLANMIRTNGYDLSRAIPVARMPDGRLVQLGGHHRAAAMRLLGEMTIPTRVVDWNSLSQGTRNWWRQQFPNFPWDDFIK